MLSSIHPFGERSRQTSWRITVAWYLIGTTAGGATMGAVSGWIGSWADAALTDRRGLLLVAVGGLLGVAADLRIAGMRVPTIKRQVDERWLMHFRGWAYGLGFGFQLGLGLVTIIPSSAIWLTWLVATTTASPTAGATLGMTFGLVRGSFILLTAGVQQPSQLRTLHRRLAASAPGVACVTTAGLAVTAVLAFGAAS